VKKTIYKKSIYHALFTLLVTSLFIIPGSASTLTELRGGSTIYVDDSNINGPWDGSIDHPYQFIQDGIDHAVDGDTVYVYQGSYRENVVVSKSIDLFGEDRELTSLSAYGFGTVIKIVADNVNLRGFTITHCGSNSNNAGVMIHTSNNIITNNNIQYNENFGLYVIAGNNLIYHNNIIENTYQAFDVIAGSAWDNGYPTGGNYWSDSNQADENEDGIGEIPYPTGNSSTDRYPLIHPYGSITNENTDEIFLSIQAAINDPETQNGHTIQVREGIYWEHLFIPKSVVLLGGSTHDKIIDGRFSGNVVTINANDVTLQGLTIQHSGGGEQNAGVIINGNNCSIEQNTIYDNFQGIVLKESTENTQIMDNKISDNGWNGILLNQGCRGVYILGNTIANNFYAGLGITQASNNFIYHNNFKANRHQAYDDATNIWDNGSSSGGNYWSDYTGSDENGDGYGDTPYAIPDGINTDQYPLMAPYTGGDTIPPSVTIQSPSNGIYFLGFRLFSGLFKKQTIIYGPITIDVEATDVQSDIEKVEFLIDDSVNPVHTATQPPYSWEWSQPFLFMRKHTIIVVAYDNAGNSNFDMLEVRKYL